MPIHHVTHSIAAALNLREHTNSHRVSARRIGRRSLLCALSLLLAATVGCGGNSGGNSGDDGGDSPVSASTQVDEAVLLPPGDTSINLGWEPSNGPVDSYLIFESRNNSGYSYSKNSDRPATNITGRAGDVVQITVVGIS